MLSFLSLYIVDEYRALYFPTARSKIISIAVLLCIVLKAKYMFTMLNEDEGKIIPTLLLTFSLSELSLLHIFAINNVFDVNFLAHSFRSVDYRQK